MTDPTNPLIVQSDLTVMLELASPRAADARAALQRFSELEKAPEHIHTYRITPLSLWNAAVAGMSAGEVASTLNDLAKYPVPSGVLAEVHDQMGRYGRLRLVRDFDSGGLALVSNEVPLLVEVARDKHVGQMLGERLDGNRFAVRLGDRGALKQALLQLGWPVADEAGYTEGSVLADAHLTCDLRSYQADAVSAWWQDGIDAAGNGVLVLPCGAGKTVIGLAAMAAAGAHTLIIATNITSARQWIREILDKTSLTEDQVGEYSGDRKDIRPVTVATYQVLTWSPVRKKKRGDATADGFDDPAGDLGPAPDTGGADPMVADGADSDVLHKLYPHLGLFDRTEWGLIVYDEVHLLPAPVFRATARIQAVRRLGLTATLVREDGKEADVFGLIGPKRFDVPWKELELHGWIAPAICTEVRVGLHEDARMEYALADPQQRYRLAACTPRKADVVRRLVAEHDGDRVLVIGQFVDQLKTIAAELDAPLITGQTAQKVREARFESFRTGETKVLVVSKVANFSIDLPEANVAIQVSGTFGSRQEEAQRLGRIMRPKHDGGQANFYTIVTRDTVDQTFAANRQRFLAEQGYDYRIVDGFGF
ncbi:MAG: DEAD/DEAH box helicase [Actinobacteria bacterium]|nr:DEAD/DEAH box helicase [Actinomycetota bacterium]